MGLFDALLHNLFIVLFFQLKCCLVPVYHKTVSAVFCGPGITILNIRPKRKKAVFAVADSILRGLTRTARAAITDLNY